MSKRFHWLGVWDFERSRWRPLGCRGRFEETADLVPTPLVKLIGEAGSVIHLGTVVCASRSVIAAQAAFDRLPPPPKVGGVDPVWRRH